ncbi:MAG: ribonucleoside-diphosphate reductase subunit alpha [Candidatus Pacebacteria bacterium]|nr:ribonucleoside-diphosphate reductase subunit alpha [Candidatus Paceibacterota bacterium]MBP9819013.1 ribonucleoside-diphosphate reductase subunit alpha [Candidatus Paceibacterota bacterium]
MNISVTKQDGSTVPFNADYINKSIERACQGLPNIASYVTQIASETQLTLYDRITTDELDQATINAALQNVSDDFRYDKIATRLLLKTVYRRVVPEYDKDDFADLEKKHKDAFAPHIKSAIEKELLHSDMEKCFDLKKLAGALDISRDEIFAYAGLSTFLHRYSVKDSSGKPLETPQYFFMRVAMGMSYHEKDPTTQAIAFYNQMSQHKYIAGGSTNLTAGTPRPALSNCYLLEVHDDMQHIAKSVADVMLISKGTGGLGVSITKLRATGSILKSSNTTSSGPTPFAKIMDTAIHAIVRGGKKKGALCFYMENWHYDFPEFIHWRHNAGDDYMRMRTANTAAYIPDEFMKRVAQSGTWYLFDPKETPDLNELYGEAFSKRYAEYIEMAEAGKMVMFKKMPAEELYRQMLVSLQTTSHPWLTWKDTINVRALNNNTGTIHMSNLCTEICLPQDKENIAVCNLASLNIVAHLVEKTVSDLGGKQTIVKEIDWKELEKTTRLAVRHLDNLIDINKPPVVEAAKSDKENRAVGLGVMGFSDLIEKLGFAYDSEDSFNLADKLFEFISYMAIDESADLAVERGSYTNYDGSMWSKGLVPYDSLTLLEQSRGEQLLVTKDRFNPDLNWDTLRAKVKKGIRNATLMAVAPNANIGLLAGTVPGIDVRFAQAFSRNKFSGKYLDINHNLVKELEALGIWDKVKTKIIENRGDIESIDEIPDSIKKVYQTSFSVSPYAVIEVAARAQKWVDQALSRNMYLETRDINQLMHIYSAAWKKGLKSTYYLHMKPQHNAEQSTTNVNKQAETGKRGFAAMRMSAPSSVAVASTSNPDTASAGENVAERVTQAISQGANGNVATIQASAHANPDNSTITVDVEATMNSAGTSAQVSQGFGGTTATGNTSRPNVINPNDFGVDPGDAMVCDGCQ